VLSTWQNIKLQGMGQKLSIPGSYFCNLCCCKKTSKHFVEQLNTKLDSAILLQPIKRQIDSFDLQIPSNHNKDVVLIWLDERIDVDLENTARMKDLLEQINDYTRLFSNKEDFFQYIKLCTCSSKCLLYQLRPRTFCRNFLEKLELSLLIIVCVNKG
jgi:hypothetical protein